MTAHHEPAQAAPTWPTEADVKAAIRLMLDAYIAVDKIELAVSRVFGAESVRAPTVSEYRLLVLIADETKQLAEMFEHRAQTLAQLREKAGVALWNPKGDDG